MSRARAIPDTAIATTRYTGSSSTRPCATATTRANSPNRNARATMKAAMNRGLCRKDRRKWRASANASKHIAKICAGTRFSGLNA